MSETERLTKPITVVLAPSTKEQLADAARKRNIKMSNLARIAIIEWLARESE